MRALNPIDNSRRRSRSLRFETLESRLALTGLPLSADAGSLVEYLTQPQEMGPVWEPMAASAAPADVSDELVAQLALTTAPPAVTEAEGEFPPGTPILPLPPPPIPALITLLSFSAEHAEGGWVRLSGTITAADPTGALVLFGGLFTGQSTTCDSAGNFSLLVPDPGIAGLVTAYAPNSTNILTDYLD